MSGIDDFNRAEPGSEGAGGCRRNAQLWRWLKILTLLQGNPGLTSRQLSERCEVSRRTIFRDIEDLNGAGVPIHYEKGYRFTGDFLMRPVQLKVDEAVALTVAATALATQGGPHHREAAQAALDKVKAVMLRALARLTGEAASRIRIDLGAFAPGDAASDLLGGIEDAVLAQKRCDLTYYSRNQGKVTRLIREARWHPSQELIEQPDGSLLMKVTTGGRQALLRWVLGFAGRAVVVEPEEMREELIRMAEAATGANRATGDRA